MSRRKAADLISEVSGDSKKDAALIAQLQAEVKRLRASKRQPRVKVRKGKAAKHITRVIIPDSHGAHIDIKARDAFLADLAEINPDEVIGLGDHLDCGGTFSSHARSYTNELTESFDDDVAATNEFFDAVRAAATNASVDILEGNHEQRVERWVVQNFPSYKDATMLLGLIGPEAVMRLKEREFRYYKRSEQYDGLSIHGAIKRGKCYFVHGVTHAKDADAKHLERFSASVVFGHVHRAMGVVGRTVTSDGHGAWCPGTLAKLQPLYAHTHPTSWSHGYGLQFINKSTGTFLHINVPIMDGVSMLQAVQSIGRAA